MLWLYAAAAAAESGVAVAAEALLAARAFGRSLRVTICSELTDCHNGSCGLILCEACAQYGLGRKCNVRVAAPAAATGACVCECAHACMLVHTTPTVPGCRLNQGWRAARVTCSPNYTDGPHSRPNFHQLERSNYSITSSGACPTLVPNKLYLSHHSPLESLDESGAICSPQEISRITQWGPG
jgi:hypothetical protein